MHITHIIRSKRFRNAALALVGLALVVSGALALSHRAADPSLIGKNNDVALVDYSGKTVRFGQLVSGFNHKPLIVYFWATWCPYCSAEFTDLSHASQQYGSRIEVVAVNRGEPAADAKQFTDALGLPDGMLYLLDPADALFKKLGGYAMPETLFINNNGAVVFQKHGPITADEIAAAAKQIAP